MTSDQRGITPVVRTRTTARTAPTITSTSEDDGPVVRWPEPSRLESWWDAIMYPTAPPASA
ncbi:hypothetical protein [Nocardia jejuensis]|uniref:hypothetical protein n=1 Tax=Nocardia jejuensis TaxID=328049 RepID=UPI00082D2C61|nr:hypothetical protein [Nocardia jejuensis]